VEVTTASAAPVPFERLLGQRFTVAATQRDGTTRHFSGICSRVGQGSGDGPTYLRLELVPQLWVLTRHARSRMFQDLSVPQIISRVLTEHGISYDASLQSTYPARDCVVQYSETDFQFISRLMEEEGIFYFFKHQPGGQHTMILGDGAPAHPAIPGSTSVEFSRGSANRVGTVSSWEKQQEIRSGKYTLRDYSFDYPHDNLEVTARMQEGVAVGEVNHPLVTPANAGLEIYDYPGDYAARFDGVETTREEVLEEGQRTVEIRMQQEAVESLAIAGTSDRTQLTAGHRFSLVNHPGGATGEYVLTSVQHSARVTGGNHAALEYSNTFTCIPAGLPFRPQRVTPNPAIPGTQPAIVAGPAGEPVHTDGQGRVKVQFPWDRESSGDENSSCWVRVAASAAAVPGTSLLPEVGDEVLVVFLEGDPDQPIIIGSVPNRD
jgi:type VI secretion system secreted protein VgrG